MTQLEKLYQERSEVLAQLDELDKRETSAGRNYLEHEDYRSHSEKLTSITSQIEVLKAADDDRQARERLVNEGRESATTGNGLEAPRSQEQQSEVRVGPFGSLGEQLRSVIIAGTPNSERSAEARSQLLEVRAPSGLSTVVGEDGGFLVQTDFSQQIWKRTYDIGQILSRVRRLPVSRSANSVALPYVKETSRATGSRRGGVRAYWKAEAAAYTESKPTIDTQRLELEKLTGLVYLTDEVMEDAALMEGLVRESLPEELRFVAEDAIIRGNGVGQPLGVLNSPCLVSVAKESGQTAATVGPENVIKMWARFYGPSRQNGAWFHNQDVETQFPVMVKTDGTAYGFPVLLPPGGLSGSQYSTLYGRPMVPIEYAPTLGTVGDLMLADFSQYALIEKGGIGVASSVHVRFLYDEMVLKFTWRLNGMVINWPTALTPFKGTSTLSPFVVLATRS